MEPTALGVFNLVPEPITNGLHYRLLHRGDEVSYERAVHGLCEEREVRELVAECLRIAPYEAFIWEIPPVTAESCDRAFEFMLIDSPILARVTAEPAPFARELGRTTDSCVAFPNLSGDAWLVVPRPLVEDNHYAHLARFVRVLHAPRWPSSSAPWA